ncbi:MAG: 4-(cytidine 5'-diphospho)-2-C-methyl-D-erythritol kinase, partial [Flavobacteriales bacterium]|nr:4-(cytidine 5'-diphospho)-2-C-methyl-D-erythritol kinase [Flavobacteriales bacterium]
MILFPHAKINIGLNILGKREDGYHNISSVFYPVSSCADILEITEKEHFLFESSGVDIPKEENLCEKAFSLLRKDFSFPNVHIHLHKQIPIGAGLGGGSADAAFTLKGLNELFELEISSKKLEKYALQLGADCPFFIDDRPALVEGIGEKLSHIDLDLSVFEIRLV